MDYMDWEPFYNCWIKEGLPASGGGEGVPFVPLLWKGRPLWQSVGLGSLPRWGGGLGRRRLLNPAGLAELPDEEWTLHPWAWFHLGDAGGMSQRWFLSQVWWAWCWGSWWSCFSSWVCSALLAACLGSFQPTLTAFAPYSLLTLLVLPIVLALSWILLLLVSSPPEAMSF